MPAGIRGRRTSGVPRTTSVAAALGLAFMAGLAAMAAPAAPAARGDAFRTDPFAGARVITLDNGLTAVLRPVHSDPVVAVQAYYRVGARNETIGITGIAHYLEHMLFRGTEGFGLADVTGVIERAGGEWHGYTWLDGTTYFEAAPRALLPTLLRLEAERMTRARMAPDEVDPERGAVFQEYRGYQLDPRSDLFDATMALLFQQHPYRNNTMGWESDLAGITHADLQAFYRRYYGPRNAVLAIAGDFDPAVAEAEVRSVFGAIPAGGDDTSIRTVEPPLEGPRRVTLVRQGASPAIIVSFLAPPPARPKDYAALTVLDTILARARGLSFYHHSGDQTSGGGIDPFARLAAVANPGPAAEIGTAFVPTVYPGHYSIYATPRPGRSLSEIESAVMEALAQAAQSITDDEVARARRLVAAADSVETDAPVEIAHELAYWTALGGPGARRAVMDAIGAVAAADVRALAATFTPARAAVGILLPPAFIPDSTATDATAAASPGPDDAIPAPGTVAKAAVNAAARCGAAAAQPASRARRRHATTRRLGGSGRDGGLAAAGAIVDARPDLATFVLRVAIATTPGAAADGGVVARLRAAAGALATDRVARAVAAACGVSLAVRSPGDGRFDERDSLQIEAAGPADALEAAVAALQEAAGRALAAAPETAATDPPGSPEALAFDRLDAAVRDAQRGAPHAAGGVRFAAALVSPFDAGVATPHLDSLARKVGASVRRWPGSGRGSSPDRRSGGAGPFAPGRRDAALSGIPQGRLLLAVPGDADAAAQDAVAWLLHHDYSGRLGVKAIAETGLVYGMDSESARRGPPLVLFTMGADPEALPRLETALGQVLDDAAAGFSADEVAAYRSFAAGRTTVRLAHPDQAARLWTSVLLRGGDDATPAREARLAQGLTPEAVSAAAARMLATTRRLAVVVGRDGAAAAPVTRD